MLSPSSYVILDSKVTVITGGSRGIGKAIADALISNGGKVAIGDLLEEEGQAVVKAYNEKAGTKVAVFLRTDVTEYVDNIALFKLAETEFGGVDYALINAGVGFNADSMFTPLDDKLEEKIININTTAVIKGTKVALLHMAKRGGGSIVHLASSAGLFSSPNMASYCASKHAVVGYTRSFQLMPQICNVRVNAICPFWVDTDLVASVSKAGNAEDPHGELISKTPRTSMKTVVDAFLTLITDDSRNTETLMALPDGLHVMEPLPFPASFRTEVTDEALKDYVPAAIGVGKLRLAEAIAKYEQDNTLV